PGVLDEAPEKILRKGRLQPGKLFLVDLDRGGIVDDEEIKREVSARQPYGRWYAEQSVRLADLPEPAPREPPRETLRNRQLAFGYAQEDMKVILAPLARQAEEAVGSMGNDSSLAVLSDRKPLLYSYFKQLFAQVTNPPIDSIREAVVMSVQASVGSERNLLEETREHARQLVIENPIVLESGEARSVHSVATLVGYGAAAVNPYLMLETLAELVELGRLPEGMTAEEAQKRAVKGIAKGLLKTMSKMGISTMPSYCGAQIFEAVGLAPELVERHFTGTASRIGGIGIETLAEETLARHARGYPGSPDTLLPVVGLYAWRRDGEHHQWNPETIALLQHA